MSPFLFLTGAQVTKSELIDVLAKQQNHLVLKDVESAVKCILEQMNQALSTGERIEIRGFGSFKVVHRASRVGRNPRTGESVHVPPKRAPLFKTGKSLRSALDVKADKP